MRKPQILSRAQPAAFRRFNSEPNEDNDEPVVAKLNNEKLEPTAGKRPSARETQNFSIRYLGLIGEEARKFQINRLPMML